MQQRFEDFLPKCSLSTVSSAKEIEVSADLAGVITKLFSSPIERDYAGEVKVVAQPAFGI